MQPYRFMFISMYLLAATLNGCNDNGRVTGRPPSTTRAADVPVTLDLSGGFTDETLRPYIGQQITVIGLWEIEGKLGGYIHGSAKSLDGEVYVTATTDRGLAAERFLEQEAGDGATVEVSGVLHWVAGTGPPVVDPLYPHAATTAPAPEHFYFDVEDAGFRFRRLEPPKP